MTSNDTAEERFSSSKQTSLATIIARNFWPLITLLAVAGGCFAIIQTFKKPGQMSVIESQAMDMSAMVPPKGALPVAIAAVKTAPISGSVTYTGSAIAYEDEDIYPRIEGRIVNMPVYPGDRVRKGDLLVQLDSSGTSEYLSRFDEARFEAQAQEHDASIAKQDFKKNEYQVKAAEAAERAAQSAVAEAQASLDYWTPELQREADLLKKQVISQQEYDNEASQQKAAAAKLEESKAQLNQALDNKMAAQTELDSMMHHIGHRFAMSKQAEAKEKQAQIVESYRRIVSSADAVVTKRVVSPGVVVSPGMLILKLAHINKLRLQAELANTDVDKIQVGAPVYYQVSDRGEEHKATVTSIFPAADPTSRTFIVEAVIDNVVSGQGKTDKEGRLKNLDQYILLPGQYIVMRIVTGQATGLVIPARAVIWKEGKAHVWKAVGGNSSGKATYTCMMHPEINSDKAGKCPKCGMDLIEREKGGQYTAQLVEIKVGVSNPQEVQVVSGLAEDDQVIYEGQEELEPGNAVVATDWGTDAPAKLPDAADISDKRLGASNNFSADYTQGPISAKVSMLPLPLKAGQNQMSVQLTQAGKQISGATLSGTTSMPTMMNMAGPDLHSSEKNGTYMMDCNFSSGLWEVKLDVKVPGQDTQHLTIEIEVP